MRTTALLLLLATACSTGAAPESDGPASSQSGASNTPAIRPTVVAIPHLGSDGNHRATVSPPATEWTQSTIDVSPSPLRRITATVIGDEIIFVARDETGNTRLIPLGETSVMLSLERTTGPLILGVVDNRPQLVTFPADIAELSEPALLSDGSWVYIAADGDVVVWDGSERARLAANALTDGRVLVDESDRVLVLTDPSDRYAHGILGDELEATSWSIFETPSLTEVGTGGALEPAVFELRYPLWADLDGDGVREILLTESGPGVGARLVVHDESGREIAASPPIGTNNRWRHTFAAGPTAPDGGIEIIEVVTPHLSGDLTAWTFDPANPELTRTVVESGFTSHAIGSRVLDGAALIHTEGEIRDDIVLLSVSRQTLVRLRRVDTGFDVVAEFVLPAPATSNLLVVSTQRGSVMVIGTRGGGLVMIDGRDAE